MMDVAMTSLLDEATELSMDLEKEQTMDVVMDVVMALELDKTTELSTDILKEQMMDVAMALSMDTQMVLVMATMLDLQTAPLKLSMEMVQRYRNQYHD